MALASKRARNLRVYLFSLAKRGFVNGDASKRANASEAQGVLWISRNYTAKLGAITADNVAFHGLEVPNKNIFPNLNDVRSVA